MFDFSDKHPLIVKPSGSREEQTVEAAIIKIETNADACLNKRKTKESRKQRQKMQRKHSENEIQIEQEN